MNAWKNAWIVVVLLAAGCSNTIIPPVIAPPDRAVEYVNAEAKQKQAAADKKIKALQKQVTDYKAKEKKKPAPTKPDVRPVAEKPIAEKPQLDNTVSVMVNKPEPLAYDPPPILASEYEANQEHSPKLAAKVNEDQNPPAPEVAAKSIDKVDQIPTAFELALLQAINSERMSRGLSELKVDGKLMEQSRSWCLHMMQTGSLSHSNYNCGENIARGQQDIPEAVRTWMASPGHRANILNRSYTTIGGTGYSGTKGPWWINEFK